MKTKNFKAFIAALSLCSTFATAQTFPLSDNFWSNPDFQNRVMGSYGAHTELEPKLSDQEAEFFRSLVVSLEADLAEGATLLEQHITPQSSAALDFMLGTVRLQLNEHSAAIASYENAIRKFPNFMRAYKNLGIAYVQTNQLEKGIQMLVKGMELGGADGLSYGLLGYCYLNLELYSSALNAYNLAIAFDPKSKDWKLGKVRCLMELQGYAEAAGLIRELIIDEPRNHELYLHQANVALAREQPLAAMADLEIVRRMDKGGENSLFLLGDIYANRGMFDLAIDAYEEGIAAAEKPEQRFSNLSRAIRSFVENEAWQEARRLVGIVHQGLGEDLERENRLALLNLEAEIELGANNNAGAAATLETIVQEDPMNGRALLLLARYHWKEGDPEEAAFLFERAAGVEEVAAKAFLQHGQMLVERKRYAEAAKLIRKSLDLEYENNVADYLRAIEDAARAS